MTVWELFDGVARRYGDRVAVEVQRAASLDRWTYRTLHDHAVAHAVWLRQTGVGIGDRCAILADNDASWCAAYLGILGAGAIAVPLDTNYGPSQVRAVLDDAEPRVLFVNARLESLAREALGVRSPVIVQPIQREPAADVGPPSEEWPASGAIVAVRPDHTAVILYTSGTTADPKGVMLSHANLTAERDAAFAVVAVSEHDSVLGVLPLFHALAQLANLLLPFAAGARVVFLESVTSGELVRALGERQITIFACVPQFFYLIHQRLMADVTAKGGAATRAIFRALLAVSFRLRRLGINLGPRLFGRVHCVLGPQMRLFITGGSKFDPAIGRDFYALGFTILQAYGLTETSGAVTLNRPGEAHIDTVGRALPGQELRILPSTDPELDGEVAIRGPIVMQGYYNRPDATAEVLRDGWFLSGDLGRLDHARRLTITGRKKEIIVLSSGKNIYPEEIEAHYRGSAFVKEICVMGLTHADEPTTERLFAVVVPDMDLMQERRIVNTGDVLRFELEGQSVHMPAHKRVLGYEIWFEPLPRTTTGKLKRHEIERRVRRKQEERDHRAAQPADLSWAGDQAARTVVGVLTRRVRQAAIHPDSNLELDLGLDSMERVETLAEIEQRTGVRIDSERAHQILTVTQLIDAVRSDAGAVHGEAADSSWDVILRDLPAPSDPVLGPLLAPRPFDTALFRAMLRTMRLALPRVTVSGLEHVPRQGPFIISPNHQSYLDPFFICGVLPYRVFTQLFFVGAAEYFATPWSAWLARKFNLVPVDPDANLVPAMQAGAFGLTHGKILILFPEGERSIDGQVKRFKKGAAILSRQLGVPIVPVAIHGVYEIWPRGRAFNWRMLLPWSRHRVQIAFGAPIAVERKEREAEAASALRDQVDAMWQALDRSSRPRRRADRSGDSTRQRPGALSGPHDHPPRQ